MNHFYTTLDSWLQRTLSRTEDMYPKTIDFLQSPPIPIPQPDNESPQGQDPIPSLEINIVISTLALIGTQPNGRVGTKIGFAPPHAICVEEKIAAMADLIKGLSLVAV